MSRCLLFLCAVIGFTEMPASAAAQTTPADSATEASLVLALSRGIFPALSEALSWDVVSGRVAPWTVTVRDSANPRWKRVQQGLRLALPSGPSHLPEHFRHRLVIDRPEV